MGRSGMKRKGRKHLPKAGTRPANEQLLHDERAGALHPFSSDPYRRSGPSSVVTAVIVGAVLLVVIFAFIAFT